MRQYIVLYFYIFELFKHSEKRKYLTIHGTIYLTDRTWFCPRYIEVACHEGKHRHARINSIFTPMPVMPVTRVCMYIQFAI